jgi:hypothetical protein
VSMQHVIKVSNQSATNTLDNWAVASIFSVRRENNFASLVVFLKLRRTAGSCPAGKMTAEGCWGYGLWGRPLANPKSTG